jgi:hypothetical protein
MRLGWNPANSEPAVVDSLFEQREKQRGEPPIPAKGVEPSPTMTPAAVSVPPL